MPLSKDAKRNIFLGILFGLLAIVFALLYYFNVIKSMEQYLAVIYVIYFVGISLFYTGRFFSETDKKLAKVLSYIFAFIGIIFAIVMLVYGFATDKVSMFN